MLAWKANIGRKMRISELSLEEKIGQRFFVGLDVKQPTKIIEELIVNQKVGGILLYKKNYQSIEEMVDLINECKKLNREANAVPLWIGIDQEGGRVNRLPPEILNFPSAYQLAQTGNEVLIKESASLMAELLQQLGINVNFAPVLDRTTDKLTSAIGDRAFGQDISKITIWGDIQRKEFQQRDVLPIIKHFPGHGSTNLDSHRWIPSTKKTIQQLEKEDMIPFLYAIRQRADALLVGHLIVPHMTHFRPATLSKSFIQEYLRHQLHYDGLIFTDDMRMRAVELLYGTNQASIKAFFAGNDVIVVKYSQKDKVLTKIRQKLNQEKWQEDFDASVKRILVNKEKYHVTDEVIPKPSFSVDEMNQKIQAIRDLGK